MASNLDHQATQSIEAVWSQAGTSGAGKGKQSLVGPARPGSKSESMSLPRYRPSNRRSLDPSNNKRSMSEVRTSHFAHASDSVVSRFVRSGLG